jgi:hypothetical protein
MRKFSRRERRSSMLESGTISAPADEQARLLILRVLQKWGRTFFCEDLSNELERNLRLLSHGEVGPMLKRGRKRHGGQAALISRWQGVYFANYLIGRGQNKHYLAYDVVARLFGFEAEPKQVGEPVRKWERTELPKSFPALELKDCWQSARNYGARHDSESDDEMWRRVTDAAAKYRRLNNMEPSTSVFLLQLRNDAGFGDSADAVG